MPKATRNILNATDVVCLDAAANSTAATRHAALRETLLSTVGKPTSEARVLVMNTIDKHYTHLVGPWAAMVEAGPFPKRTFVVAMDVAAARACAAASVPHFAAPRSHNEPGDHACTKGGGGTKGAGGSTWSGVAVGSGGPRRPPASSSSSATPEPGSYKRIRLEGKEADTRILPPDLPAWKFHGVRSALSLGWRVLFSETDVLWLPDAPQPFSELLALDATYDYAPQRHPMTPVYNFGFFLAQGMRAENFFGCLVGEWERRALRARAGGAAVEIASDQRFLYDSAIRSRRGASCGALHVRKLPFSRYPTCRAWVGGRAELMYLVHLTYCHRLSQWLSSEDVCKRRLVEAFYLAPDRGGVRGRNLTSKAWNLQQGC